MGAHNLDTQIEGLHKLVPSTKRKLFVIMKIDREEDTSFYLTFSQEGNIYGQYAKKPSKVGWMIVASTVGN